MAKKNSCPTGILQVQVPADELLAVLVGKTTVDAQVVLQVPEKRFQSVGGLGHSGVVQVMEKVGHGAQDVRHAPVQLLVGVPLLARPLAHRLLVHKGTVALQPCVELTPPRQPVVVRRNERQLANDGLQLAGNQQLGLLPQPGAHLPVHVHDAPLHHHSGVNPTYGTQQRAVTVTGDALHLNPQLAKVLQVLLHLLVVFLAGKTVQLRVAHIAVVVQYKAQVVREVRAVNQQVRPLRGLNPEGRSPVQPYPEQPLDARQAVAAVPRQQCHRLPLHDPLLEPHELVP